MEVQYIQEHVLVCSMYFHLAGDPFEIDMSTINFFLYSKPNNISHNQCVLLLKRPKHVDMVTHPIEISHMCMYVGEDIL